MKKKSLGRLKIILATELHKYIRNRDRNRPCISCGQYVKLEAGHFYPANSYSSLKFDENNIHGQCVECNRYKSGNFKEYEKGLSKRIGIECLEKIHKKANTCKKTIFKWDRFYLIDEIERYKSLNKTN